MQIKTLKPSDIKGHNIIVRVDYNVPVKAGVIQDQKRIDISLETIDFLLKSGAKRIFLMSHLGRPEKKDTNEATARANANLSLEVVVPVLEEKLGQKVAFETELIIDGKISAQTASGSEKIVLLENLRFNLGEKKNSQVFAKQLAAVADIYVNDAFSASHRAHSSISAISELLPSFAGFSLVKEVEMLSELLNNPKKPFVMIVGGAKISDKVSAIKNLAKIADTVLVGGGVANNFLKAEGFDIAKSYLQDTPADMKKNGVDFVKFANSLLDENKQANTIIDDFIPLPKIIYPIDVMVAKNLEAKKANEVNLMECDDNKCYVDDDMFLDIGPRTIKLFSKVIESANTIFWNGPMGVFENDVFADGTRKIAKAVSRSKARSILGGGDTISAIRRFNLEDKYTYVSTAGGASLEFLSGEELPGLRRIVKKD